MLRVCIKGKVLYRLMEMGTKGKISWLLRLWLVAVVSMVVVKYLTV